MSARSVNATLINTTNEILILQSSQLMHGTWATPPPATIEPNGRGQWEADSDGFAAGVEGTVQYQIGQEPMQSVSLYFDNPYVGSDEFLATCAPPMAPFICSFTSDEGNDANVTYALSAV